ncbi:matrixin family metalloprotease [Nocardioides montaniterrae]
MFTNYLRLLVVLALAAPLALLTTGEASATTRLSARVSATTVAVDKAMVVSGTAAPSSHVQVSWMRDGQWQPLGAVDADTAGDYTVTAPTWWIGQRSLRIATSDASTALVSYDVHESYTPAGSARSFSKFADERYWNPCRTISWVYNPKGGYTGSLRTMKRAIATVSSATGIRFKYVGRTSNVAFVDSPSSTGAKLLISWATPRQVPVLAGTVVGNASTETGWDGYYKHGSVVLDRTHHLRHGFHASGAIDWGQVILHELGHVMGLAHTTDRSAIMFKQTTRQAHRYSAGDLAGLKAVGAGRACA